MPRVLDAGSGSGEPKPKSCKDRDMPMMTENKVLRPVASRAFDNKAQGIEVVVVVVMNYP